MEDIINELNKFLSDLNVFYRKVQNYHWNIEGKDFFQVHAKLEEYYNEINEQIDEIAEQILVLGGEPLGTMKDYLENTKIQEAKNEKINSECIFKNILDDMGELLRKIIEIKIKADEKNEYSSSAMMDNYIANYSKKIWMLKQLNNM